MMAGCGMARLCLVLLCSFQAALSSDIAHTEETQCPVIPKGDETDGQIPLYVGIFPEREEWEWGMDFVNARKKTFFHLSLQSGEGDVRVDSRSGIYGEIQPASVKWSGDAFPLREWSYLAVYFDGDHLTVAQKRDSTADTVKMKIEKHEFEKKFKVVSNASVIYNCIKGHSISSASGSLQVESDKIYCVQAVGPTASLTARDNATISLTGTTWHQIQNQTEEYSVDGVIFVIKNCRPSYFASTTLITEGTSPMTTTEAATTFTNPTTLPEQSESSTVSANVATSPSGSLSAEDEGHNYTSGFPSTPMLNTDGAETFTQEERGEPSGETSEMPSVETSEKPSVETSEMPSGETSEKPSVETSEKPSGETSGKPSGKTSGGDPTRGPSGGAVAAIVIAIVVLLLTVVFVFRRGYHREVFMLWHNATQREEGPVEILTLQKDGSLKQKGDNE